jgi:hypothetical protein
MIANIASDDALNPSTPPLSERTITTCEPRRAPSESFSTTVFQRVKTA